MCSLTTPQVAATLGAGVVAFKTLNPAGQRLIDEPVINTIPVPVIVTAVGGTVLTGRYTERVLPAAGQDRDRRQPWANRNLESQALEAANILSLLPFPVVLMARELACLCQPRCPSWYMS